MPSASLSGGRGGVLCEPATGCETTGPFVAFQNRHGGKH